MIHINTILRLAIIAVLLALFTPAYSAMEIKAPEKGTYIYWFVYEDADSNEQITQPERFKGIAGRIDTDILGTDFSRAKLYIMDKDSGNMAIVKYEAPKDKGKQSPIKLRKDDFQYVRGVKLKIVAEDGKPLERGVVDIVDGEGTAMRCVVTPSDLGMVVFNDVATGAINVKVKSEGVTKTIDSDIELPQQRDEAGFEKTIKVAGDVDTVALVEESKNGKEKVKETPKSNMNVVFQTLAGIAFLVLVIAVLTVVLRSRGLKPGDALQKMGVQLPGTPDVAAPDIQQPVVDPNICPFCGQGKDSAGNCACSVVASTNMVSHASAATGPRLVASQGSYMGRIFDLTSGTMTIGREETNNISISSDSTASRRHASITSENGEFRIKDEGSSNGTFVNGARIVEQKLNPGDEIRIGSTVFRFEA